MHRALRPSRALRVALTAPTVLAILLSCAPASDAAATLSISPLVTNLTLQPGETGTINMVARAEGSDVDVEFQHADFGLSSDDYTVVIIEDDAVETTRFSTRGWFSTPRRRYHLKAGKPVVIPLRVAAPDNATPGTHLGAGFLRTVPGRSGGGSRINTAARTGPLVFVTIAGGTPARPRLDNVGVPSFTTHGPLHPKVVVSSRGRAAIEVSGTVQLSGRGKRWKASFPSRYVMPGMPRTLRQFDGKLPELGTDHLPMGRYTVRVRLVSQPSSIRLTSSETMWIIPRWIIVLAGLALVALVAGIGRVVWKRVQARREQRADD